MERMGLKLLLKDIFRLKQAYPLNLADLRIKTHISAVKKGRKSSVRIHASDVLGIIEDEQAIGPLIRALENDLDTQVRNHAAVALARYKGKAVDDALMEAAKKTEGAVLALAWRHGGDYLKQAAGLSFGMNLNMKLFQAHVLARWGDVNALGTIVANPLKCGPKLEYYNRVIASLLPEKFSGYLFNVPSDSLALQAKAIRLWYINRHRLVWDEETRIYHLKRVKKPARRHRRL